MVSCNDFQSLMRWDTLCEMPVHMVFSWLHPLLWQWCMLCACWYEKTGIFCLRVRESGTVASCQYFCLLIFTLLRLAWPWISGSRPQLHVLSVLFFFSSLCICKNTDRLSHHHHHHHREHSEGPARKEKDQNWSFCPWNQLYAFPSWQRHGVWVAKHFIFPFFLVLWLKWLEEC